MVDEASMNYAFLLFGIYVLSIANLFLATSICSFRDSLITMLGTSTFRPPASYSAFDNMIKLSDPKIIKALQRF